MNLMNQAAIVSVRQGSTIIGESEVFEALEKIHREKVGGWVGGCGWAAALRHFEKTLVKRLQCFLVMKELFPRRVFEESCIITSGARV